MHSGKMTCHPFNLANGYLLTTRTHAHFWLFLCGIMLRVRFRFRASVRISVSVRLKVLLTRLKLGILHAFVCEWLASVWCTVAPLCM